MNPMNLGEESFRWQFATAVADSIRARLGPDVSAGLGTLRGAVLDALART